MGSGVVHVYAANATSWDFSTGWYGDYVDQDVVNAMVDAGIMQMTGESTVAAAWQALLPGYSPGQGIAVKVNFNNASCNSSDNVIDALIEPVNALVRSLKTIGVQEDDIWVYDALRPIPTRFRTRCLYPGVRMFDIGWCGGPAAGFSNTDPTTVVYFNHGGLTSRRITDLLLNATYLINMPIIKDHVISCVSLGFKNHFGSIDRIKISDEDHLHPYIRPSDPLYDHNFSPLLKLNINSHILGKTILTLGDGLYGALKNATLPPSRWISFGNDAPNSLFFSTDPIAVDCVMLDILDAEPVNHPRSPGVDDYLRLGADADLGIFERGDPWGSGYTHILYSKITL